MRQALLDRLTDVALEFLLQQLPAVQIPAIEGEQDGVEYAVSNLDMSGFQLNKEDVKVPSAPFLE